jgi:tetratricopeptide (TPR) repeat protein
MGNTNAALKCWTKATQLKPDHVQSWINRIILLEQQEKLEDAKNISLEAVKAVPHSDTIHFLLGNLFGKLSKFSKAEFHFFKAIDISKSSGVPVKYFSNLGVLYHRWGRKDLAIEAYHNALKIDSNSESVKKNLMLLNK